MPVLREVLGRVEDTVYGPDGRRMAQFCSLFANQPCIRDGQIVQKQLDSLSVRAVPKPGFGPDDERDIVARIQQRLTVQMKLTVEVVGPN